MGEVGYSETPDAYSNNNAVTTQRTSYCKIWLVFLKVFKSSQACSASWNV